MMPEWLPLLVIGLLLATLPIATLLVARKGGTRSALRAAILIAAAEGLIVIGAAAWLSQPGEPLFWILVLLGIAEMIAVFRVWRMFPRE